MQNLLQILGDILSVVRTGLETIVLLIQALLSNTGRGVDQIKAMAPDVARQYLRALGITAIIAVALPVVLGGVSIFFGLKGTTAFIGLLCLAVCFVFGLVMTPIGVLINAALPPYGGAGQEKGLFWRAVQGIGRNAQEGVQKYFRSVRIVLGWEALFFFFAAILPVENYRGAVFILLLGTVGLG
ncbi:MAG: hypothetical protein Q8P12_02470, partial [bacterium]|nr:hypothetical protein [bacterium]